MCVAARTALHTPVDSQMEYVFHVSYVLVHCTLSMRRMFSKPKTIAPCDVLQCQTKHAVHPVSANILNGKMRSMSVVCCRVYLQHPQLRHAFQEVVRQPGEVVVFEISVDHGGCTRLLAGWVYIRLCHGTRAMKPTALGFTATTGYYW